MQQIRDVNDFNLNPPFSYISTKQPPVRKKSKKLIFLSLAFVFLAVTFSLYAYIAGVFGEMSMFSAFSLRKITVYGVEGSNADLIKQSLSVFSGSNLLSLSNEQIKENISKFGFVEGFLLRKTYPSEITIEIKLKPAKGCVKKQGIYYEIDGFGSVWESTKIPENFVETDSSVDLSDQNLQNIIKIINEMNCFKSISLIQKRNSDSFIITTKEKTKLIVSGENFQNQWEKYVKSKNFIRANFGEGGTVDLRWSNRVVLLNEGITPPAEEEQING